MLELVFEDSGVSHRVPVRNGLTLGRSSDNDVVLRDFSVSRHHARVEEKDGELYLVDLESTNGVRINEEFVTSGAFTLGDLLGVGSFELRVEEAASDTGGLSSATYLRPLSEFNQDYGLSTAVSSYSSMPTATLSSSSTGFASRK
jgi:pSer/pThr/pTyr-binding forkhead associated (FHA) protein